MLSLCQMITFDCALIIFLSSHFWFRSVLIKWKMKTTVFLIWPLCLMHLTRSSKPRHREKKKNRNRNKMKIEMRFSLILDDNYKKTEAD